MNGSDIDYVKWFRHSSPYINAHRGRTFVLMLSGETVAHANFIHIVQDIALLNSLGVRLVIVHGARPQIEAALEQRGLRSQFHDHLRITTLELLEAVKQAVGILRSEIEALLSQSSQQRLRLGVISGNFVTAKPHGVHDGIDFHHTGEVRGIDHAAIHRHLAAGEVVLLSPLGYSPTGEIFNLSFEQVAAETAIALRADKLIAYSEKPGVLDRDGQLLRELTPSEIRQRLDDASLTSSPALRGCLHASSAGVQRSHLIGFGEDGALLRELFTRDGAGTLISHERYEKIRPALIDDVAGIIELIRPLEEDGTLLRRSRERLEEEIGQFSVIDRDGSVIGCAALYPFSDGHSGELACVVVHPDYRSGERGDLLLEQIEKRARQQGIARLFVLTTRTAHWFRERGFVPATVDDLPDEKRSLYNYQRNSQVYCKGV